VKGGEVIMEKFERVVKTIEKINEEEPPAYCCESAEVVTADTVKELINKTNKE